jgi:nucleotide-binding universal stress UspA family protein
MYHTLLVPLDGSPLGEAALPLAATIARAAAATLHLVHVAHPSATPISVAGLPVIDAELQSLGARHDRVYLEQVAARLQRDGPLAVVTTALDPQTTDDKLLPVSVLLARHAAAVGADLLVMTTHGWGGFTRFWLGSVADALLRLSRVPILLLRAPEQGATVPPPHIRRVLIPLDGTARSEAILPHALALGALFDASYTLLQVVVPAALGPGAPFTTPPDFDPDRTAREQAAAQDQLATTARRLAAQGATVETDVQLADQVAPAILGACRLHDDDLIALSTAGRSGLQRLLLGSVADKLVRRAEVPLLLLAEGDLVAADGRLVEAAELRVD